MQLKTKRLMAALAGALLLSACASPGPVGVGYYRVQRGDTLSSIAQRNHTTVRDLGRWNKLSNPNALEVDQILRVVPPVSTFAAERSTGSNTNSGLGTAGKTASRAPSGAVHSSAPLASMPATLPATPLALVWPAQGQVVGRFNVGDNKGIDIAGAAGAPVFAAAAGKVVYAGNGLRGYGNLLIIKHNADYLTAYAHNSALLVKEGQSVTAGEQIAAMGQTDSDRVMLHFELRYQGKTLDPLSSLPPR
jgi:lipoprotein YgeR